MCFTGDGKVCMRYWDMQTQHNLHVDIPQTSLLHMISVCMKASKITILKSLPPTFASCLMYYPLRNMEAKCVLNAISTDVTILASHFSISFLKKKVVGCG